MKMLVIAAAAGVLSGSPQAPLSPGEARSYVGQNVTVEGRAHIHRAARAFGVYIDLDGRGPTAPFSGFIPKVNVARFTDLSRYDGRQVDISGVVQMYRSNAQIILTAPGQIRLADERR